MTTAIRFEQLLQRSHLRLLLRTLLAVSLLFALTMTLLALSEQTRESNQDYLVLIGKNSSEWRKILADAPPHTARAMLAQAAREGVPTPFLHVGGPDAGLSRLMDSRGMFQSFGMVYSMQQKMPPEHLQWIERGLRYAAGTTQPLGPVPAHWLRALARAPEAGVVIAEPTGSPLYRLRFSDGGLDTLLIPIANDDGRERALALVLPRYWMSTRDALAFAVIVFLMLWLGGFLLLMPPAMLLGYWQARREARSLSRPLATLTLAAEALQAGRAPIAIVEEGPLEAQALAVTFNRMSEQLLRARAELEASRDDLQKNLDAQREFFANISHDLRTPLAAISGYAEILERDHPALDGIAVIRREAANLGRLVDDLFELARLESDQLPMEIRDVFLGELLQQVKQAMAEQAWSRGVLLRLGEGVENSGDLIARVDPQRMAQVLHNLIANAIRHTAPGGYIELDATVGFAETRVDVIDSGEGIAATDLPHIFQRSFRGDRARRGGSDRRHAGFGLSIARGLVEAMGGTLDAESRVGEGSRFTIRLPRDRAPEP